MIAAALNLSASSPEADASSAIRLARHDDHGASKRELQAPPVSDLPDDLYELRTVSRIAHVCLRTLCSQACSRV